MAKAGEKTSLRALARLLKVADNAVRKAVASGRLSGSVGRTAGGRPFITDMALAKREWASNAAKPAKTGGTQALVDVQRTVGIERARALRWKNDQQAGKSIDANKAARDAFDSARVIRERVLNVPDRLPWLTPAQRQELEKELRLALETAANEVLAS